MRVVHAVAFVFVLCLTGSLPTWPAAPEGERTGSRARAPSHRVAAPAFGAVVALREVTLKAGVDPAEFERFVAEEFTPAFKQYVPGVRAFVMKGIRGDRTGGYTFALVFDWI